MTHLTLLHQLNDDLFIFGWINMTIKGRKTEKQDAMKRKYITDESVMVSTLPFSYINQGHVFFFHVTCILHELDCTCKERSVTNEGVKTTNGT